MRDLECEIWLTLRRRVLGIHQLDFLFNFGGHKARRKGSRAKGESPMDSRTSSTTRILHRYGTARRTLFRFFLHHCIGLKPSPLSVPILAQPHESIEASVSRFGRARQDRQSPKPCLSRSDCKFLQSLATNRPWILKISL